jgi:hypothetical protein
MLGSDGEAEALGARCIADDGYRSDLSRHAPGCRRRSTRHQILQCLNPVAARANAAQSAIDVVQQARLFTESRLVVPASVSGRGADIRFDASRLAFMGHSQGGINGPIFLAVDDQALGGMLSGSASMLTITLLEKTKPIDVPLLIRSTFLGLEDSEAGELDLFHPALSLAQTIVDPADPIHYVKSIALEPRRRFFAEEPVHDRGRERRRQRRQLRAAARHRSAGRRGGASAHRAHDPSDRRSSTTATSRSSPSPRAGSREIWRAAARAEHSLNGEPLTRSDGHFVIYDIPEAMLQATGFIRNLMDEPNGRVPPR